MITLPMPIDASKVEATFEDGVLTLTLPKQGQAKGQSITIKTKA